MLLEQETADGAALLRVTGPVAASDAGGLVDEVARSLAARASAVVVDLSDAALQDDARDALGGLASLPSGWPRAAVLVCPLSATDGLPEPLRATDRGAALAQVAARAERRCTRVDVPLGPDGPAAARAAVREGAARLGLGERCDDVLLLVSELVTNALRHAVPPVALEVEVDGDVVVVAVCDASPVAPQAREADDTDEGGRGMLLVELLAEAHGVRAQPPGKTVWARLRQEPALP